MRITGGRARGRRLAPLTGCSIRPTTDKVREAIFNIIGNDLSGIGVLDLFAGTGSLGLEALSRGAAAAVFIDSAPRALTIIRKNLALCNFEDKSTVVRADLRKGIPPHTRSMKRRFEVVFLDPPYGTGHIPDLLEDLTRGDQLSPGAVVVAESSKNDTIAAPVNELILRDTRRYGDTKISLFEYEVT